MERNKNIKHVILAYEHIPGYAHTNRMIAYARAYQQLGMKVSVVCSSNKKHTPFVIPGVDVYFCTGASTKFKPYNIISAYNKVVKTIKKIYNHNDSVLHIYTSPTPLWVSLITKSKYDYFLEMTEIPFAITNSSLYRRVQINLGEYKAKHCTGLLVITGSLKDYYSKHGVENVAVVNMFVDSSRFDIPTEPSEKYIAYCGMVSRYKDGVDVLIKSFSEFVKSHTDYRLKLAGAFASSEDEIYLKELVQKLGLDDSVDFLGMISAAEMPRFLKNSSILALARPNNLQSQYGFPTKLGEYLSSGRPCVITRVGELNQYLSDKESCVFAMPDDDKDFAEKLNWVADNYEKARLIGCKGKELAEKEFSYIHESVKALNFFNITINKCQKY